MKDLAGLLQSTPPTESAALDELWIGDRGSLDAAMQQVLAPATDRVIAVVGPSRTGKSHFLALLAEQMRSRYHLFVRARLTTCTTTEPVLRELLAQVRDAFLRSPANSNCKQHIVELFLVLNHPINGSERVITAEDLEHLNGTLAEIFDVTLTNFWKDAVQRAVLSSTPPRVAPLGEHALAGLLALLHVMARRSDPDWTTMLVIDDFDLLVRRSGVVLTPVPLLEVLFRLALLPGLTVLTTVRADTYQERESAFLQVARIPGLNHAADMLALYQRRLEFYYESRDPFPQGFVAEVIRDCQGKPGLFLDFLEQTMQRTDDLASLRYPEFVQRRWQELLEPLRPLPHIPRLMAALARPAEETEISVAERLSNPALEELLYEEGSKSTYCRLHPIFAAHTPPGDVPGAAPQATTRPMPYASPFVQTLPGLEHWAVVPQALPELPLLHFSAHGQFEEIDRQKEALRRLEQRGDTTGVLQQAHRRLGVLLTASGSYAEARAHLNRGLPSDIDLERDSALPGIAEGLCALGELSLHENNFESAAAHFEQARALYHKAGDLSGEAQALRRLGRLRLKTGQPADATKLGRQAAALSLSLKDHLGAMDGFLLTATGLKAQQRFDAARKQFEEARREATSAKDEASLKQIEVEVATLHNRIKKL